MGALGWGASGVAYAALSSSLFCPQHDIDLSSLRHDYRITSDAVIQAGGSGNGQPRRYEIGRLRADGKSYWSGPPETQAIEAVHGLAPHTLAEPPSYPNDYVGWAILARQQVSNPP